MAALLLALSTAVPGLIAAPGVAGTPLPDLDAIDPERFSIEDAIVERHLVPARDGLTVLAVDLIRPNTTEQVPAILFQSPYYNTVGRGWSGQRKSPWTSETMVFPEWYDEHFVPRGYAVVMQDQRGTRNSSGCQQYGAAVEGTDAVDVIEWIERQPWSNGAVGMTGGSYDGTVATAAATHAPPALKAIIPIRAIGRWYDYHFYNGAQSQRHAATPWNFTTVRPLTDRHSSVAEDPLLPVHAAERPACAATIGAAASAQYTLPYQDASAPFWAERDFLKDTHRIEAATFIIHGLEDDNVRTTNAGHLWEALPAGTPRKLWWLRGGHDDPHSPYLRCRVTQRFVEATHRWFAQFLKGLEAGALDEPRVAVQGEDCAWHEAARWPPPAEDLALAIGPSRLGEPAPGALRLLDALSSGTVSSEPLAHELRVAGQAYAQLAYSTTGDPTFALTLSARLPWGRTVEIGRAYARGAYRDDIRPRGASVPSTPAPHVPGARHEISFPFSYADTVLPAGSVLVLTVALGDGRIVPGAGGVTDILVDGSSVLVVPSAASRADETFAPG